MKYYKHAFKLLIDAGEDFVRAHDAGRKPSKKQYKQMRDALRVAFFLGEGGTYARDRILARKLSCRSEGRTSGS